MRRGIAEAAVLVLLVGNSIVDIKSRKVNLLFTALAAGAGAAAFVFLRDDGPAGLLLSLAPGFLLIILAAVSRGGIGMGDGIVLAAAGFFETWERMWALCLLGFFLAGLYGAALFLGRRRGEERFAFVPFLLLADVLLLLTGG